MERKEKCMLIHTKQIRNSINILIIGYFSTFGIAATHNDESPGRSADIADCASGGPEVFYPDYSEDAADAALALLHELGQADARQWRVVTLNPELRPDLSARKKALTKELRSTLRGRLSFNLFPDAVYEVSHKKTEITEENSLIWRGNATGPLHGGRVWFAFLPNGTVVGQLIDGPRSFQLSPLQEFPGLSVIYEIDPASQPQPRVPEDTESAAPHDAPTEREAPTKDNPIPHEAPLPPGTQATITTYRVDVMFVYTEAALRKMTSQRGSRLLYLNDARDQLNDVFNDSLTRANSNVRLNS